MEDYLIFLKNGIRFKYFGKGKINSIFGQMKDKNMAVLGIGTAQALGFSSSSLWQSYFSPRRGYHRVLKFCMGF
jgi:hypothetical protein